jgi:outer membrane protein OmpA-like peptidoglycan-associated protein
MGAMSGGVKKLAPPEMPKLWVIVGTVGATLAFVAAKPLVSTKEIPVPRVWWIGGALLLVLLAVICLVVYLLTRADRTVKYEHKTLLAGTPADVKKHIKDDPALANQTPEPMILDAAGDPYSVWTRDGLKRSRAILGIEYTLFIVLLALGMDLTVEAFNQPAPAPTAGFADRIAKLRDIHFTLDHSDISADANALLAEDASILAGIFKDFPKSTLIVEGFCDDRGSDKYNFALAYQRAEATRQALAALKLDVKRMTVTSHGKKESGCAETDEPCREKNRRAHLTAIQN